MFAAVVAFHSSPHKLDELPHAGSIVDVDFEKLPLLARAELQSAPLYTNMCGVFAALFEFASMIISIPLIVAPADIELFHHKVGQ